MVLVVHDETKRNKTKQNKTKRNENDEKYGGLPPYNLTEDFKMRVVFFSLIRSGEIVSTRSPALCCHLYPFKTLSTELSESSHSHLVLIF